MGNRRFNFYLVMWVILLLAVLLSFYVVNTCEGFGCLVIFIIWSGLAISISILIIIFEILQYQKEKKSGVKDIPTGKWKIWSRILNWTLYLVAILTIPIRIYYIKKASGVVVTSVFGVSSLFINYFIWLVPVVLIITAILRNKLEEKQNPFYYLTTFLSIVVLLVTLTLLTIFVRITN